MIATEKFNFIHLPKTGGSFTQKIIIELYSQKRQTILGFLKQKMGIEYCVRYWNTDLMLHSTAIWGQHGGINQIPEKFQKKKNVSIIRNPFDWYASLYGFRYWEDKSSLLDNLSFEDLDSYPNITINEMFNIYQQVVVEYGKIINVDLSSIGYYTWHFIIFYFKNPDEVLRKIVSKEIINKIDLEKYIHPVKFITQENLNEDLYNFLKDEGYKNIDFVHSQKKLLPLGKGRAKESGAWKELINEELSQTILIKEKLLFDFFPQYA